MLETPSGKNASTENFPVGSFLLPKPLRPHVGRFYNFARAIDDIADNPNLSSEVKLTRLKAFEEAVTLGSSEPELSTANLLKTSLEDTGVTAQHCRDLISAFNQDSVQSRYETWEDLIDYCQRSAAPVGRYLLDLHGEDISLYPASDALCHALQIINHLQDAADDYHEMNRVYIPTIWLSEHNIDESALDAKQSSPALREVFNKMLKGTEALLVTSKTLAPAMQSKHLAAETRVIQKIAETLAQRLYKKDPIATRVKLSKPAMAITSIKGLLGF
ncbi:MAG: squalene synthase HpnC [Litorimonas sp.]